MFNNQQAKALSSELSVVEKNGYLLVKGNNIFAKKDAIKALGFRWDSKAKQRYKQLSNAAFEQRAITKLLYDVIKNAPYKSYFKSLVCYEELGGITDIDNSFLANSKQWINLIRSQISSDSNELYKRHEYHQTL